MKEKILIANLQRFFFLEKAAVQIYEAVAQHTDNQEIHDFLVKFRDIEKKHADTIDRVIHQFGVKPARRLGTVSAFTSKFAGHSLGMLKENQMLHIVYYTETLAIWDYSGFCQKYEKKYPDLVHTIWQLRSDEELHGVWLREKASELKSSLKN